MSQAQNETALESMENSELLTGSMGKLFWKYALSALVGAMASCIAVILDGYFMGNGVGELALAGISIVITFMS